jgi:hypothetical protein
MQQPRPVAVGGLEAHFDGGGGGGDANDASNEIPELEVVVVVDLQQHQLPQQHAY